MKDFLSNQVKKAKFSELNEVFLMQSWRKRQLN